MKIKMQVLSAYDSALTTVPRQEVNQLVQQIVT